MHCFSTRSLWLDILRRRHKVFLSEFCPANTGERFSKLTDEPEDAISAPLTLTPKWWQARSVPSTVFPLLILPLHTTTVSSEFTKPWPHLHQHVIWDHYQGHPFRQQPLRQPGYGEQVPPSSSPCDDIQNLISAGLKQKCIQSSDRYVHSRGKKITNNYSSD